MGCGGSGGCGETVEIVGQGALVKHVALICLAEQAQCIFRLAMIPLLGLSQCASYFTIAHPTNCQREVIKEMEMFQVSPFMES